MRLLCVALFAVALCACGPTDDGVHLYRTQPKAPSYSPSDVEGLRYMGPTIVDRGVNFSVYSEHATRLEILLFEDPESNLPTKTFQMERFGNVWNLFVEGIGPGQHYGYRAWGPNWEYDPDWIPGSIIGFHADVDGEGNRFNPNKLLQDPYCKALHRDHDWSKGNLASGPARTDVTYAAAGKCVVLRSNYDWSSNEAIYRANRQDPTFPGHRQSDLIMYEVHAKGFTANSASGVTHPGTYLGFAEKADYFKDLGVTAVELMPIMEKPLDGTYWGYQTLNFFAPELSYASRRKWNEVTDEFKYMVDELHKRDIEVIVDVVYNHTGEGGFWRNKIQEPSPDPRFDAAIGSASNLDPKEVAGLYSYRGLDNQAYYALDADNQTYWNNTGVGNQTRTNYQPFRKLIIDSLRYYVEELHVDGFRFDLAPILGYKDRDYNNWDTRNSALEDIVNDPVLLTWNTRLVAEPWDLHGFYLGQFPKSKNVPDFGWDEWNGHFRDAWRQLINETAWDWNANKNVYRKFNLQGQYWDGTAWQQDVPSIGEAMTGSQATFSPNGRGPLSSVNFMTVHDGMTLYDLFSYDAKRNLCSPLNPVCCSDPFSPFCDPNSGETNNHNRDWKDASLKLQMIRNAFVAMLVAHGTPLLYGGDEWARTQLGNNNAYSTQADNEWNWFDWGAWQANEGRVRLHDFVRQLIHFRKDHAYAFEPSTYGGSAPFAWKSSANTDQVNWQGKSIMMHYYDRTKGPELAILINMEDTDVLFTLPSGRNWKKVVDTQAWWDAGNLDQHPELSRARSWNILTDAPEDIPQTPYGVKSKSIVILESR